MLIPWWLRCLPQCVWDCQLSSWSLIWLLVCACCVYANKMWWCKTKWCIFVYVWPLCLLCPGVHKIELVGSLLHTLIYMITQSLTFVDIRYLGALLFIFEICQMSNTDTSKLKQGVEYKHAPKHCLFLKWLFYFLFFLFLLVHFQMYIINCKIMM